MYNHSKGAVASAIEKSMGDIPFLRVSRIYKNCVNGGLYNGIYMIYLYANSCSLRKELRHMLHQAMVFITIILALYMFIKGSLRYDIVAILALLFLTAIGVIGPQAAFSGFGSPVVITVAAVLIISRGLINVGAVELLVDRLEAIGGNKNKQIAILTLMTAILSSFINNVGALAIVMPVAIRLAKKNNTPASVLLMPIAFGSLLGGLTTLIGTPPNIIIAAYRAENGLSSFGMFDFTKVGLGVAFIGIVFISAYGWRLIPVRKKDSPSEELFNIEDYVTEACVPMGSNISGKSIKELCEWINADINILSIIRDKVKILAPTAFDVIFAGDILILEAGSEELKLLVEKTNIGLPGVGCNTELNRELLNSKEFSLVEAVIRDDSPLIGQTAKMIRLRPQFGVNLVALSREGSRISSRLKNISFRAGDIILFQAKTSELQETLSSLKCLPLADRDYRLTNNRENKSILVALATFVSAIALTTAGLLSPQVSFVAVAVVMVLTGIITTRDIYESIDWPIIVLIAALLPVGEALEATGGSELIASLILRSTGMLPPAFALLILMLVTVLLTNVINNAAAAVLMAPIAISVAAGMGKSPDAFLMAVAIAASSAFLTPIGHQSNTLVMGPGGYHFKDYWKMGLPLTILVLITGLPLILLFWPL